jgi:hypothetical protein
MAEDKDFHTLCGWCGKSEADGVRLVAGPITCICAQCCALAAVILQIIPPELIPPEVMGGPKLIPPELLADLPLEALAGLPPELLGDSSKKPPEMAKDDDDNE